MKSAETLVWSTCGHQTLKRNARGWLTPTDGYWRGWLERAELALVEESCEAEQALHEALVACPTAVITAGQIDAMADEDVRANYRHFLALRDAVVAAGSLEAAYAGFFKAGSVAVPPLFLDLMVQAIVCNLLQDVDDAWQWRAAELLFRHQRIQVQEGRVLCADQQVVDLLHETGGMGELGRLLVQGGAALPTVQMEVLGADNEARYWISRQGAGRFNFVLDLTHEVQRELSHGLTLTMNRSRSGLTALAAVLEKWVQHFLGAVVHIQPMARVEDVAWRWHLGLDAEASALLNDLYQGLPVEAERQKRLASLFALRFASPLDVQADMQGKPVYLGLAMSADGLLKLKAQNLLLNLPLAQAM